MVISLVLLNLKKRRTATGMEAREAAAMAESMARGTQDREGSSTNGAMLWHNFEH